MGSLKDVIFGDVDTSLLIDEDRDVSETPEGLTVKGRLFAYRRRNGDLVVDLPVARAHDLAARAVAAPAVDGSHTPRGAWVSISDPQNWAELAGEAHQFVGEPSVGKQS